LDKSSTLLSNIRKYFATRNLASSNQKKIKKIDNNNNNNKKRNYESENLLIIIFLNEADSSQHHSQFNFFSPQKSIFSDDKNGIPVIYYKYSSIEFFVAIKAMTLCSEILVSDSLSSWASYLKVQQ
jgi:hypothetical protein